MNRNTAILLLKITCFCVFLGRAWLHINWDAPYRAFFWDEDLLHNFIERFTDMSWQEYVTSPDMDRFIQNSIKATGFFYLLAAIASLAIKPEENFASNKPRRIFNKLLGVVLLVGMLCLMGLAYLYCKEKFYHVGQFFEYACQFLSPLFLWLLIFNKIDLSRLILPVKIAIALTFTCHGLYAIGYYPRPGPFVDMTLNILPIEEPTAHLFLKVAGVLDFVISAMLFIPRLARPALLYAILWGSLTALARVVANFYWHDLGHTFGYWFWEMLYRVSHASLPLLVWLYLRREKQTD